MSFLDPITAGGPATELVTTGDVPVNVSQSEPPHPGDVLIAVDATHATWQALTGGGSGTASALATSGAPVNVGGSTPPSAGNVLVATGPTAATWQPGLALTSAAPSQVSVTAAVPGVATTVARADHVHSVATAAPAALTVGGVQSAGAATSLSRSDHEHAMPALATSVAAGFLSASDKLRLDGMATGAAALTSSAASTVGTTNTVGVATAAARADHVHAHGSQTDGTLHATATAIAAGFLSGADKSKLDGVAAGATNTTLSSTAAASVGATNTVGVGTTAARADHVHAHGVQTDGTLHADATPTVAGFLSAADKTRLDGMTTGSAAVGSTAATQVSVTTAAAGSLATAARSDHVHSVSTGAPSALAIGSVQDAGAATSLSRSDHVHAMPVGGAPSGLTLTGTNSTGVAATVALSDHVHALPASSTVPSALTVAGTGSAGSSTSISKADHVHAMPGLATSLADGFMSAADKAKFDTFDAKESCRLASTTNITLSGFPVVDGVTPAAGERVLVTGQTTASANGIYVAATGAWSRSADADISTEVTAGLTVRVNEGTAFADTLWILTTNDPIVLGTTALVFAQAPSVADKVKLDGIAAGAAALTNSPASTVGTANTVGVGTTAARTDHVHAHGAQVDGTLHAVATTSVAGFLSTADKTKLDAIEAGAQVVTFSRVQTALGAATSPVGFNAQRITGVADPTSAQDVATKAYADAIAQGLDTKASVRLVATSNVPTLSGAVVIDGVTTAADRVLLTAQTAGAANGLYLTNAGGAWARTADADTSAKVTSGMYVFATEGTANADSGWALITPDPIVLGTTALTFTQVSGAGQIVAGAGLTKAGNTLNVVANADASIVVASDDIKVGVLATDAQHGVRGGGTLHAAVTTTTNGFMLATDKVRLDAMATGATNTPLATLASPAVGNTAAAVGVGTTAARQDHTHLVSSGAPVALTLAGATAAGTAATLALSDHVHALPATAAPAALTVGGAGSAGVAVTLPRSDHAHAMPGLATTAVDGFFAAVDKVRLDGMATSAAAVGSTTPIAADVTAAAVGVATTAARSDHRHQVTAGTPVALTLAGTTADGTSTSLVRADHVHALPATAAPAALTIGAASSAGAAVTLPRSDHVHAMPGLATIAVDGFQAAADKLRFDGLNNKDAVQWLIDYNATLSGAYSGTAPGDRALATAQSPASANGIYVIQAGAWVRAPDADTSAKVLLGMTCEVLKGKLGLPSDIGKTGRWTLSSASASPIVLGTTSLTFTQQRSPLKQVVTASPNFGESTFITTESAITTVNVPSASPDAVGARFGILNYTDSVTLHVTAPDKIVGPDGVTYTGLANFPLQSGFFEWQLVYRPSVPEYIWHPTSAVSTIRTAENPNLNGYRLAPTSDDSVPADGTFSTVYLVPVNGDQIALYTGTRWIVVSASPSIPQLAVTGRTAGTPFDIFAYWTGTTIGLEVLNWSTPTARATAVVRSSGVWIKSGDATRRYLGTVLPSSATQYTLRMAGSNTTPAICPIWNVNNRIRSQFTWQMTSTTYVIPTANVWALWEGNAGARCDFVVGVQTEETATGELIGNANSRGGELAVGIGYDSTSVPSGLRGVSICAAGTETAVHSKLATRAAAGAHSFNALVRANTAATSELFGTTGLSQSGLNADISW